jgi:hypothetical protein
LFATIVSRMTSANLTPASGRQDHTTSPSASAPLVLRRYRVHRIPHPTSVTCATPLSRDGMAGDIEVIWVGDKEEYFCGRDWTAKSQNSPSGKSRTYDVRFSNRPFGVKHFQTFHQCGVDVARGLVLLFGIGTKALPSWDPRTRRNNLYRGLAVNMTAGPSGHTNSPHPSSREGHLSTARWNSSFLLSGLILNGFHAAAAACSRVHRNSVPSTQMRCMITASRRARATIAFFIPRRLAICMAQALSQDHFFECIML